MKGIKDIQGNKGMRSIGVIGGIKGIIVTVSNIDIKNANAK